MTDDRFDGINFDDTRHDGLGGGFGAVLIASATPATCVAVGLEEIIGTLIAQSSSSATLVGTSESLAGVLIAIATGATATLVADVVVVQPKIPVGTSTGWGKRLRRIIPVSTPEPVPQLIGTIIATAPSASVTAAAEIKIPGLAAAVAAGGHATAQLVGVVDTQIIDEDDEIALIMGAMLTRMIGRAA